MAKYVLRRVLYSIPVLILASDPDLRARARVRHRPGPRPVRRVSRDKTCIPRVEKQLGLDQSLPVQYVDYMSDFVQGQWGDSQRTGQSVADSIRRDLWDTSQLAFWAVLFSGGIAVAVGVYSASKPYSPADYTFTGLAFAGVAMPTFWFGLLMIQYFTYELQQWTGSADVLFRSIPFAEGPQSPLQYFQELALPVFVLSIQLVAGWSRYQRSSMLEELNSDYIRTAKAKGLRRRKVIWKHGLRNSLSALVTVMAIDIGALFGGLIITERVFSRPGMGTLLLTALAER